MDERENFLTEYDRIAQDDFDYDEEPFVVIDESNEEKVIRGLCNAVFAHHLSDEDTADSLGAADELASLTDDNEVFISGKQFLAQFLKKLPKSITVVQEGYHIDRSFRDTYYMYFSNQHFQIKRYSRRLSFFKGTCLMRKNQHI